MNVKILDGIKIFLKMIAFIIGASLLAMILMWLVYFLPAERMAENVVASTETLRKFDDSQHYANIEYWKVNDTTTNSIILHEVIYPNTDNALRDSLLAPTADFHVRWFDNWTEVLLEYANERSYGADEYVTYARYWHGYLVVLKPLFMFFDLQIIHVLNGVCLFALTGYITYVLWKRFKNKLYWIVYLLMVLLMNPVYMVQSFQLSAVFWVMQIILAFMLSKDSWKDEQMLYLFVLDGILVAFLDFLTYPLVAFAVPALLSVIFYNEKSLWNAMKRFICQGISFVVGYAGMWGMKWILASLITEENVILDAFKSILHRTGIEDSVYDTVYENITVKGSLYKNLITYFNEDNMLILFGAVLVIGILLLVNRKRIQVELQNTCNAICILVAILPFLWMIVLYNHCALHPHLEWRTLSVLTFAIGMLVMSNITIKRE